MYEGDTQIARNAILDVLASAKTKGDLKNYISNIRKAVVAADMRAEREANDDWHMQNYGMTAEEYEGYVESVEQNALRDLSEEEKDAIFAEEREKYYNQLNSQSNEQGRTESPIEASDSVLPTEQVDNTRRDGESTEGGQNIENGSRVDSENGTPQEETRARVADRTDVLGQLQQWHEENEDKRRAKLRERVQKWEEALGVKIRMVERLDDVKNRDARAVIASGKIVTGWYNTKTGEVYVYLPFVKNRREIDKTVMHELVAHNGLRGLLGKDFDALCDKVWEMMPEKVQNKYLDYLGVSMIEDETERRRAAADEYMAHLSEREHLLPAQKNIWNKIVDFFRELFGKKLGKDEIMAKEVLDKTDLRELLRMSYENMPNVEHVEREEEGVRFRFSKTPEEFEETQKEAVEKKGIVMDGLNEAVLNIVDVPRHDFTGTGKEAISKAKEWAKENLIGEYTAHENTEEEFKYSIDSKAVKKYLSGISTSASDNLGVHLSVLKTLTNIINESIEAEIHADYKKVDGRTIDNGADPVRPRF